MPEASFIYPQGGSFNQTINVFDQLDVTYTSQWPKLNFTVFCLQSATSSSFWYWNANDNPVLSSGTYIIPSIDSLQFPITQYPVNCSFKLTKYGNNSDSLGGDTFVLTSTTGAKKTFQQTQTSADTTTYSTLTATATAAGVFTTSLSGSQSPASATSSPTTTATGSGLSSGAAAGVGVGVGAGVLLVAALLGFLFWSKRKRQRSADVNRSLVSYDYNHFSKSDGTGYAKTDLPGYAAAAPIYEPDSRVVIPRQELMAHEGHQHPKTDVRYAAEMP